MMIYGVDGKNRIGVLESKHAKYDLSRLHDKIKEHLSPIPTMQVEIIETQGKHFPTLFISAVEESVVVISKNLNDESGKQILRAGEIYLRQNTQSLVVSSDATIRRLLDSVVEKKLKKQLAIKDAILNQILGAVGSEKEEGPILPVQTIDWRSLGEEHIGLTENSPSLIVEFSPKSPASFSTTNLTKAFGLVASNNSESYPLLGVFHNSCKIHGVKDEYVAFSEVGHNLKSVSAFNVNGSMSTQFTLIEDTLNDVANSIKIPSSIRRFTLILDHAFKYLACLQSEADWSLKVRVFGIKGRKLLPGLNFFPWIEKTTIENKFEYERVINQNTNGQFIPIVKEMTNSFFHFSAMHWKQE